MSRYIDADAITNMIKPMCGVFTEDAFMINYHRVLSIIENAPSIDIVRCKECKYAEYRADFNDYECHHSGCGLVYDADDFCSYGERREP